MNESLEEKRILIVDDTKENIDVLGGILSAYKRSVALNGMKALSIAKEKKPDLILLDIMMPEMDGFEVCERLKADPDTKDIPVIFITAKNEVEDEVKGLQLGAVDFIAKPISPPIVEARVRTHLELKISRENLEEKNHELSKTLTELKETQSQLIHSEKMAALGQLIAGIAHEINNPIGAIKSSNQSAKESVDILAEDFSEVFARLDSISKTLFFEIIESSKSKSFILSTREERALIRSAVQVLEEHNIKSADDDAEYFIQAGIFKDFEKYLPLLLNPDKKAIFNIIKQFSNLYTSNNIIGTAVENASKITFALKNYSRFDSTGQKTGVNLTDNINTVLVLYQNKIKKGITLNNDYEFDGSIEGYPDELTQVWTNLIHNALQAMDYSGSLEIKTVKEDDFVKVSIKDSGPGIPEDIKAKIFNPFFTTKALGEGTGLGLDIVRKIIEKHSGKITFESQVGEGTTFYVYLPLKGVI